jgi:hypothetical protein
MQIRQSPKKQPTLATYKIYTFRRRKPKASKFIITVSLPLYYFYCSNFILGQNCDFFLVLATYNFFDSFLSKTTV